MNGGGTRLTNPVLPATSGNSPLGWWQEERVREPQGRGSHARQGWPCTSGAIWGPDGQSTLCHTGTPINKGALRARTKEDKDIAVIYMALNFLSKMN